MKREQDFDYKIEAIRAILVEKGYSCIEIKSQALFSYITKGRGFIGIASTMACANLFITLDGIYLVGDNIDTMRIYNEQMNSNPLVKVLMYQWYEPSKRSEIVDKITNGLKVASEGDLESELFKLRTVMTPYDKEEYKKLCHDAATIVEDICKNLKSGITEYELAGEISKQFWSNDIEPITLLVAFDERALLYRHPVMVNNTLKNYALVGICGRRNGLIVSITRDVLIDRDEEMIQKHDKCVMVNAAFLNALKIDNTLEEVFENGINEYSKQGYPQEYQEHHQGGLTGYIPREMKVNFLCKHLVRENEVYAFNPTIQGAKCEDTVLVTESGIEIMTYTGNYAYKTCEIDGQQYIMPTVYVIN